MISPFTCFCYQRTIKICKVLKRVSSTKAPNAVFIEKVLEYPIIVVREEDDVDIIGPPDPVSNLRPVIRKILKNETVLQRKFRETADATQNWNQKFWAKHNTNFIKLKEEFIQANTTEEKKQLNADEMSEFYKEFLNKNWKAHVTYNFEWYSRNFSLLLLALGVSIQKALHHLTYKI